MQSLLRTTLPMNSTNSFNNSDRNVLPHSLITPSTLEDFSNEISGHLTTHREQIPLFVIVYLLTIIWILYLILYHSRIQGIILTYILRRFYFKDTAQIKFDSFSISFISGKMMFRNLNYTTGTYSIFIKDGYLVFRYWSKAKKKAAIRLKIQLNHLEVQLFSPIRSNTFPEANNQNDDLPQGSTNG